MIKTTTLVHLGGHLELEPAPSCRTRGPGSRGWISTEKPFMCRQNESTALVLPSGALSPNEGRSSTATNSHPRTVLAFDHMITMNDYIRTSCM